MTWVSCSRQKVEEKAELRRRASGTMAERRPRQRRSIPKAGVGTRPAGAFGSCRPQNGRLVWTTAILSADNLLLQMTTAGSPVHTVVSCSHHARQLKVYQALDSYIDAWAPSPGGANARGLHLLVNPGLKEDAERLDSPLAPGSHRLDITCKRLLRADLPSQSRHRLAGRMPASRRITSDSVQTACPPSDVPIR